MKIKVTLIGPLRKYFHGIHTKTMDFEEGMMVLDLLKVINMPMNRFMITINGVKTTADHPLKEGDEVVIFPIVSGG